MTGPTPQRRPGDGEDHCRRRDPNAAFLGQQSTDGNSAGLATVSASREAGIETGGNFALDGLVRAFVGAGARSVLASHWPVPDDFNATENLISSLFKASPGTAMNESLAKAQRAAMDDPLTSHPYYWAAFILLGDGTKPLVK